MRTSSILALALSVGHSVLGQELFQALSGYPEASTFQGLIGAFPGGITQLLPSGLTPNGTQGVTVLVPSNAAFSKFLNASNVTDITKVPPEQLFSIFQYHVMAAKLTSKNFTAPADGLVVPTLLKDTKYNNRTAGADLVNKYGTDLAGGQVVFVSKDPINPVKFRVRQRQQSGNSVSLRGGLGQGASMQAVDGNWAYGHFQIVDTVLAPPTLCSSTIKSQGNLAGLDTALNKLSFYPVLDVTSNVTCLAPSNAAFAKAGDPQNTLNTTELTQAILFHTLEMPVYTPFLKSGDVVPSKAGPGFDVTITKVGGDVYFNDAKVVSPNVLTNNGLIHVLDRVMSPNGTAPSGGTATTTASATGTAATATSTATSAAAPAFELSGGLLALVAGVVGVML